MAKKKESIFSNILSKLGQFADFFWTGIWQTNRDSAGIRVLKTLSLSVRSFMDRGLQWKSMALTYSTVLAIVPALALLLAIGKGFGFQNLLENALFQYFPSQSRALATGLRFVDSYLAQASSGLFVGIGIIVLLWTLVSLLSSIEQSFNAIWDLKRDRTIFQQITDYIAICLIIPVLIICSSGVSIFVSALVQDGTKDTIISPLANVLLEASPIVLVWLAFAFSFCLIPNTRVNFKYAAISGAICAVAFQILQLLFVNGQIYVSKYNAIYGSFAFLPLLLIWLQLSWLITLFGCVLTFSLQNVFAYNFLGDLTTVSPNYMKKITLVVATVIAHRFANGEKPYSANQLSSDYGIPIRVVSHICEMLVKAGLLLKVVDGKQAVSYTPSSNTDELTVGDLFMKIDTAGESGFIPGFAQSFPVIEQTADELIKEAYDSASKIKVIDLPMPQVDNLK